MIFRCIGVENRNIITSNVNLKVRMKSFKTICIDNVDILLYMASFILHIYFVITCVYCVYVF